MTILSILLLILVANGSPILVHKLLKGRFDTPLDGGRLFLDGKPMLGASKTVRGLAAAMIITACSAKLLGLGFGLGLLIGALSMLGDVLASFVKRRLSIEPSGIASGLDQIPESLFPALGAAYLLSLSALEITLIVLLFFVIEVTVSPLLFRLNIRKTPY